MKKIIYFVLISSILFLTSCATNRVQNNTNPVYVTNTKPVYILSPENMEGNVDSVQLLNGSFGDTSFTLFVYFQSDENGIFMSLLNDFGTDMGTLSYDGNQVVFDSPVFPESLKAEYILLDIQNAYYSKDALSDLYSSVGLSFTETDRSTTETKKKVRCIKKGDKIIEEITIFDNSIRIQNILRGYEYNLTEGEE